MYSLTPFIWNLAVCASTSCCCWPGSHQHYRLFSVQSSIPPHWPENTKPQFQHFLILSLYCIVHVFVYSWPFDLLTYNRLYSSGLFSVELSIAGSQVRLWHAKHFTWFHWQLQKPPTWQGSRHESPSEATPLALFPALAGAQEFSPVYYSCQWGTEKKTLSHNKICLETDIYVLYV